MTQKILIVLIIISSFFFSSWNEKPVNQEIIKKVNRNTGLRRFENDREAEIRGWENISMIVAPSPDYTIFPEKIISNITGPVTVLSKTVQTEHPFKELDLYFHIKDSLTRTDRQDKLHVWVQYSADSLEWTDWMGREYTILDEALSDKHTGWGSQASYPYGDILYHFYKFKIIIDVGQSNELLLHNLVIDEEEYLQENRSNNSHINQPKSFNKNARKLLNNLEKFKKKAQTEIRIK